MNYETTVKGSDSRPYATAQAGEADAMDVDDTAESRSSRRRLIIVLLIVAVAIAGFFAWRSYGPDSAPPSDPN